MELRALAERILLHPDLEVKLTCPDKVTDENPGKPVLRDLSPERNHFSPYPTCVSSSR